MSFKGVHEHPKNICKMCLYAPRVFCWKKVQFLIRFSMGYGLEKMNNYDRQNSYIMKKLHLMKTVPWKTLMENPNLWESCHSPNTVEIGVMISGHCMWGYVFDIMVKLLWWGMLTQKFVILFFFFNYIYLIIIGKHSNLPRLRKILFTPLGSDSGIVSKYWSARTSNKPTKKIHAVQTVIHSRLKINGIKLCAHYQCTFGAKTVSLNKIFPIINNWSWVLVALCYFLFILFSNLSNAH